MRFEKKYPRIIEHHASRNFKSGDRIKAFFEGKWFGGVVIEKYKIREEETPCILIKTDERVSDESDSLLGGFGLEGKVNSPFTIFEYEEPKKQDKIYSETYDREMTPEEKKRYDDCPF